MIEKIIKAVKSSNKRRGRNITIGAVVGFLLSCTAVMRADEIGVDITEKNGEIEINDNGKFSENTFKNNIYTNNMTISAENLSGDAYGIKLTLSNKTISIINNGSITGIGKYYGYGIYNAGGTITKLTNNGLISGSDSGIYNDRGRIETLINNGLISGSYYGIYNVGGTIELLINNGLMSDSYSGIWNNSGGTIETLTNNGLISGSDYGICNVSGGIIETLTNNGLISGSGYGIYNNRGTITTLTNNGLISGSSEGIYNYGRRIETLINNGLISGSDFGINNYGEVTTLTNNGLMSDSYSEIWNNSGGTIETLINNGLISGSGFGINNYGGRIETLTNNGLISDSSEGIYNYSSGTIGTLTNNGLISGSSEGIYNSAIMRIITNTGVIYGKTNAIKNDSGSIITTAGNYGILANGSDNDVIAGLEAVDVFNKDDETKTGKEILNKGLIFKATKGKYTAKENDYKKFGQIFNDVEIITGYKKDGEKFDLKSPIKKVYTIINAKAVDDGLSVIDTAEKKIIGTESLELKDGTLSYNTTNEAREEKISSDKRYILNGITDTLKVSGKQNELNDSIINAYGTAVVMNEDMSTLTLDNTIVNGGIPKDNDIIPTVNITGNGNTLSIQGDSAINGKDTVITVTGDNNAVTLEGNTIVNGKMESVGNNTLNLYGKVNRDSNESSMNILHDVTGFINMNIENNVTFFEDVKVTGTETVTVHKNGVLNLRLKKEGEEAINTLSNDIPVAVHAFSDRDGKHKMTIKGTSEGEAGTLNFITNGIGKKIDVDMKNIELENMIIKASSVIDKAEIDGDYIHLGAGSDLSGIVNPKVSKYDSFNEIYKSLYSSTGENLDALRDMLSMTFLGRNYDYNNATDEEQLKILMTYLNSIYTGTPYSYSSELSRRSAGMFRDITTENQFRPDLNRWLVMGGLTHRDGGTKDSYYGQNYHGIDGGTAETDVDMKLTGAYALGKYGYSENVSLGVTAGGNRSEAELSMSKVKGNSGYIGAFAENYRGNLTLKAGAGIQYSEYDADRATLGGHSYSDKYSDMTYDIYLNGRYSHNIGNNLFLEPYGTLSYTYIKQDSADEGNKVLAIETDSKSFDYTAAKVGVDLKKVIPHEKGKSTLSAGVSYTRLLTGADEENITGRFKGKDATNFDILVAHKNEHSIELNAKYTLELESGILFDVKGSYNVERDSHNGSEKNRNKGEWIVDAGLGYKF